MSRYFYADGGQSVGPLSAQQLQQLAASGRIQPQTMIWAEGAPSWLPASQVKGLFARQAVTAGPPPVPVAPAPVHVTAAPERPAYPPHDPNRGEAPGSPPTARLLLVGGIVLGVLLLLGGGIFALIKLGSQGSEPPAVAGKDKDKPAPTDKPPNPVTPPKDGQAKPQPDPMPMPKPEEVAIGPMDYLELLRKYRETPVTVKQDLIGKRVILTFKAIWNVEDLKKTIVNGQIKIYVGPLGKTPLQILPGDSLFLTFPDVDPNAKLGFFAKMKEYAAQRKRGDKVEISVTGLLTTQEHRGLTFLHLDKATLN